jgi:hypothetical protein
MIATMPSKVVVKVKTCGIQSKWCTTSFETEFGVQSEHVVVDVLAGYFCCKGGPFGSKTDIHRFQQVDKLM